MPYVLYNIVSSQYHIYARCTIQYAICTTSMPFVPFLPIAFTALQQGTAQERPVRVFTGTRLPG